MMSCLFWPFATILAIVAVQVSEGDHVSNDEASVGDSELTQAFRTIFQRALSPKGTYHRYLLLSTGIVPPLANYEISKEEGSGPPPEIPLTSEVYEHFKKHVSEILASSRKLSSVIDRLFGDRTAGSNQESKSLFKTRLFYPILNVDFKMTEDESEEKVASDFSSNEDFSSDSSDGTVMVTAVSDVEPSQVDMRTTLDTKSGTTSGYLKFLTDGLALSTSSSVEDETKQDDLRNVDQKSQSVPLTQDYINFLRSESTLYSTEGSSTKSTRFDTEGRSTSEIADEELTEVETDFSETTQFVPILTTDYIKFLASESPFFPSTEVPSTEATDVRVPIDDLQVTDDFIERELTTYLDPESESSTIAYSPLTGEFVSVSTAKLDEEPSFSTAETVEYWVNSSPQTDSDESEDFLEEKQTKSSTREGRTNIVLGDTGGPLGQIFPNLPDIPDTNFTCDDKKHIPGFYADNETSCQVFHVCWPGRRESFLCPWGTTFNQAILACDYWDKSVCAETVAHYDVNSLFKETLTGASGPAEENLLQLNQGKQKIKPKIITEDEYITELLEADVHFSETVDKHNLTTIWKKNLLPVRVKIYEQPHPDFSKYLFKHQSKSKRSKDDADDTSADSEDAEENTESEEDVLKKLKVESIILNVLRKLSEQNSDAMQ